MFKYNIKQQTKRNLQLGIFPTTCNIKSTTWYMLENMIDSFFKVLTYFQWVENTSLEIGKKEKKKKEKNIILSGNCWRFLFIHSTRVA